MKGAQVVAPNTNMRTSHNPLARQQWAGLVADGAHGGDRTPGFQS